MKICASTPNKVIIAGEHGVVYGSWAVAAPIEVDGKRNRVTLTLNDGEPKVVFKGDLGESELNANGEVTGHEVYHPILAGIMRLLNKFGKKIEDFGKTAEFKLEYCGAPKGTGNSSSIPACVTLCITDFFHEELSNEELFEEAFFVDNIYHGGKASGIDPKTVTSSTPQELKKVFLEGGIAKFEYHDTAFILPEKTVLVLVDSYKSGTKNTTAEMIEAFAKANNILKKPFELTAEERRQITKPFDEVVGKIEEQLKPEGDAGWLGKLMDKNNELLKSVSCEDIEKTLQIGRENGALGGKITGGGGVGGAVLMLCWEKDYSKISKALKENGFENWKVEIAKKGPQIEEQA